MTTGLGGVYIEIRTGWCGHLVSRGDAAGCLMNLPNSLTVFRIFFVPLLVVVLLTRQPNFIVWGCP